MKKLLISALTLLTLTATNSVLANTTHNYQLKQINCSYDENNYVLVTHNYENTTNNPLPKIKNFLFTAVKDGEVIGSRLSQTVPLYKTGYFTTQSGNSSDYWSLRHSKEMKTLIVKNTKEEYKDFLLQKVGDQFLPIHDHYSITEQEKADLIADQTNFNGQRNMKYGVIPAFKYSGVAYEICL